MCVYWEGRAACPCRTYGVSAKRPTTLRPDSARPLSEAVLRLKDVERLRANPRMGQPRLRICTGLCTLFDSALTVPFSLAIFTCRCVHSPLPTPRRTAACISSRTRISGPSEQTWGRRDILFGAGAWRSLSMDMGKCTHHVPQYLS